MDQQQIMVAMTLGAVIIVFGGMLFLALRFLNFVQTIILELVRPGSTTPVPVVQPSPPAPPPAPAPTPAPVPTVPPPPAATPGLPLWYTLGLKDVGFHETGVNRGIETFIFQAHVGNLGDPWCAIWANAKLEQAGVTGTRSASSQSFTINPNFISITKPTVGCIVVFWRDSKSSGIGHVGFYVSETTTSINTLGGNESDGVRIEALPKNGSNFGLVGYYWPKSVPLPSSGPVSAPADSNSQVVNPPPPNPLAISTMTGKMSTFGGPTDKGVAPDEGLALCEVSEMDKFDGYFLPEQPPGTTGLARRLDPASHYIACRWDYKQTSRSYLQGIMVMVTAKGKTLKARPIDWGPNTNTGRICDMSPGLAAALGLQTDNTCTVDLPVP
jgi:uncharacterized protein (TIGR02594 family)